MSYYTDPKPGEHVICYAYPSSPRAVRLGHGATGCYSLRAHGQQETAHATYGVCAAVARGLGTMPGRWSEDHPMNARPGLTWR